MVIKRPDFAASYDFIRVVCEAVGFDIKLVQSVRVEATVNDNLVTVSVTTIAEQNLIESMEEAIENINGAARDN